MWKIKVLLLELPGSIWMSDNETREATVSGDDLIKLDCKMRFYLTRISVYIFFSQKQHFNFP